MAGYKTQLAATLFADVLKQAQEAKQAKSQVETSEVEHGREKEQVKADGAKGQTDWRNFEELKAKHSDAVLLFRCRDFYESYKEDADRMANVLGLDVSERDGGIHVASFPKTALDTYLPKLVRSGVGSESAMNCLVRECPKWTPPLRMSNVRHDGCSV